MLSLDEQIAQFTRLRIAATGERRAELERGLNLLLGDRRAREEHLRLWEDQKIARLSQPLSDEERACLVKRIAYWTKEGVLKVNRVSAFQTPDAELLAFLQPGDTLYWYETPRETWEMLCGRAGFAVVRDKRIVAFELRMMN